VIEIDGGQHACSQEADRLRTAALNALGYRVIRFWNHEVLRETDSVLQRIAEALQADDAYVSGMTARGIE
jgi:adenine-specific DNA-methyltransferase